MKSLLYEKTILLHLAEHIYHYVLFLSRDNHNNYL